MKTLLALTIGTVLLTGACTPAHSEPYPPEWRARCVENNTNPTRMPIWWINKTCKLTPEEALPEPSTTTNKPTKEWGSKNQELLNVLRGIGAGW